MAIGHRALYFSERNSAHFLPRRERAVQAGTARGQYRDISSLGHITKGRLEDIEKRTSSDYYLSIFFKCFLLFIGPHSLWLLSEFNYSENRYQSIFRCLCLVITLGAHFCASFVVGFSFSVLPKRPF